MEVLIIHKISLISSVLLFFLGCITLGGTMICSTVLPQIFKIYLMTHPVNYSDSMLQVNLTDVYYLALAELILGAVGYLFYRKKA